MRVRRSVGRALWVAFYRVVFITGGAVLLGLHFEEGRERGLVGACWGLVLSRFWLWRGRRRVTVGPS
jgi:hypothetical protein